MDNCFTGRRDRSRQTSEKDVLYKLPAGPVTECAFARWRIVLSFLSKHCEVIASFSFGAKSVQTCFQQRNIFEVLQQTLLFYFISSSITSTSLLIIMSSPGQKQGSCRHVMALFDNHKKCARCREKGVGDDPCVKKLDCQICKAFTPAQVQQLATPTYKARKEHGEQNKSEVPVTRLSLSWTLQR